MESPHAPQKGEWIDNDPAIQVLQKCPCLVAEECKTQEAVEQEEEDNIVGRLVSANCPSTFRTATGAKPQQYVIQRQKPQD